MLSNDAHTLPRLTIIRHHDGNGEIVLLILNNSERHAATEKYRIFLIFVWYSIQVSTHRIFLENLN